MGTTGRHPLIDRAYRLRREGDRRGALALYAEAARQLDGGYIAARASAMRHAADLHEELGESDAAWQGYQAAWDLYRSLAPAPDLDVANCRRPMALWQARHGSPETAQAFWREAREAYEKAAMATGLDLQVAFDECDRHIAGLTP